MSIDPAERRIVGEGGNLHFGALLDTQTGAWVTNASTRCSSLAFAPDGQRILRGVSSSIFATNGLIEIVDLNYKRQKLMAESGGRVFFAPNNQFIVTGPWAGSLKLWSWPELKPLGLLNGGGATLSVSFSPDSTKVAGVSQEGRLCVWDVASQRLLTRKTVHGASVIWSVAFSPDGKRLATAGTDQTVRTWDAETLNETHVYRGHSSEVWCAIWSKDGRQIISCGKDMTIRFWNAEPSPAAPRVPGVAHRPVFSPDGRLLAARLEDGTAIVWESRSQKELVRLHGVAEIGGISSDNKNIIVLTEPGEIQKRAIADGMAIESRQLTNLPAKLFKRMLSPSGRWLVYGGAEGELLLIDTTSNDAPKRLVGHRDTVLGLAFSPDERRLLTGSVDRTARLWELPGGKLLHEYPNHRMSVGSVAFSKDGTSIVTGCWDDTLHVWDVDSERERVVFSGHEGGVQTVAYAPDNRTVLALTGTGVLKFWSIAAQREAGQIRLSPGTHIGWLSMSNDGQWLAAVMQSEEMILFSAPHDLGHSVR
jgi:WD40 repeat protein